MSLRLLAPLALVLTLALPLSAMCESVTPESVVDCVALIGGDGTRIGRYDLWADYVVVEVGSSIARLSVRNSEGIQKYGAVYYEGGGCTGPAWLSADPMGLQLSGAYDGSAFWLPDPDVTPATTTFGSYLTFHDNTCIDDPFTFSAAPAVAHPFSGFVPPFHLEAEPCAGPAAASLDTLGLVAMASLILLTGMRLLARRKGIQAS